MNDDIPDSPEVTRRQVMKALAATAICPMVAGCEFADVDEGEVVPESTFSVDDPAYADLAEVGGTACHDHGGLEMLLVRTSEDEVVAFDRVCPHQSLDMGPCDSQFPAEFEAEEGVVVCNWHGSRFDTDGTFREDLPHNHNDDVPDLRTYPVEFDPDTGEGSVVTE